MDGLILIDVQKNMFDPNNDLHEIENKRKILLDVLNDARKNQKTIVFIQNNGSQEDPDYKGTLGWEIESGFEPRKGEYVFEKNEMNSFSNTLLEKVLHSNSCDTIYLCGFQTNYCVNETEINGIKLGFNTICISDGHSTCDEDDKTASEIIKEFNSINGRRRISSEELIRQWNS